MRPRHFNTVVLILAGLSGAGTTAPAPHDGRGQSPPFDLEEATVASLLSDQQSGRRTAREIAAQYLARIEAIDRRGPALRLSLIHI